MPKLDKIKLRPKEELVIVLEDLDFSWYKYEIEKVKKLWIYGWHIADIAKYIKRDQDEVAALIMHLARKGEIQKRKGGIFGGMVYERQEKVE